VRPQKAQGASSESAEARAASFKESTASALSAPEVAPSVVNSLGAEGNGRRSRIGFAASLKKRKRAGW
jgi:hypothetical protein